MTVDVPYIVLILVLLALTLFNAKDRRNNNYFIAAVVIAFIFTAFRAPVVGADTYNYVRFFTGESIYYSSDRREFEPLFTAYNAVMKVLLFRSGFLYMIVNAFLSLLPVFVLVKHNSYSKTLSVFWFFLTTSGMLYFVVLRQILSMAIILGGVIYVQRNRPYKLAVFILLGVIAYFMHTSAIYVMPVYLLCYFIPMKRRWVPFVLIGVSIVSGLILKNLDIMKMLSAYEAVGFGVTERLDVYLDEELVDTSEFSVMGILKKSLVAAFVFLWMPKKKLNHWFSKIYLVGVVLWNFFFEMQLIDRIVMPFDLFGIICLTWAFGPRLHKAVFNYRLVSYVAAGLMCFYLMFGYVRGTINYDPTNEMRMHPYYFFFQDYHDHPSIKYNFD